MTPEEEKKHLLDKEKLPENIGKTVKKIQKTITKRFPENIKCLVLYGSWAKGTASVYSDIDLLTIFERLDNDMKSALQEIERIFDSERSITLVPTTVEEFQKENNPLYTAVKREGKQIWGKIDFTFNPEPSHVKYAEYFEKSREFETKKVEMVEKILKDFPNYTSVDICFVASKHAIQMALAMKGAGYSSKVEVLLPLAKQHLGEEVLGKFKELFDLYIKSEYFIEPITNEEMRRAVKYAREILGSCYG